MLFRMEEITFMNDIRNASVPSVKKAVAALSVIYAFFVLSGLLSEPCYASGFNGEETNIGSIIQALALGGGAVGLAWSGLEYAYGDEQKARKAKARMVAIAIATAAVFALPAVVRTAQDLFQSSAWSPDHLTTK